MLASVLACSLVASTSFAFYRASMGPAQCCKSHCRHHMPKQAAEQCCRTHADLGSSAAGTITPHDAVAPALTVAVAPVIGSPLAIPASGGARRGPPGGTLLAQHTSLAL